MEAPKNELSPLFEPAAAPPPERVTVELAMDADVLAWLKEQPTEWQRELNNLARFFMETNLIREAAFDEEATGPEHELDTSGPDLARNASKFPCSSSRVRTGQKPLRTPPLPALLDFAGACGDDCVMPPIRSRARIAASMRH